MKIHLAGINTLFSCCKDKKYFSDLIKDFYCLESFCSFNKKLIDYIPLMNSFLLDSGAFTFMNTMSNSNINWVEYVNNYCQFIKNNNIKQFFELDIDKIIGYEKVKDLRKLIEDKTGLQPIPVWHITRGIDDFCKMCEEYKYVSIGGIVVKEFKKSKQCELFEKLIQFAHKKNCKIHGLGYTDLKGVLKLDFDSVDSTSWLTGIKFGHTFYEFDNITKEIKKHKNDKKQKDRKMTTTHQFIEWKKFSLYINNIKHYENK